MYPLAQKVHTYILLPPLVYHVTQSVRNAMGLMLPIVLLVLLLQLSKAKSVWIVAIKDMWR